MTGDAVAGDAAAGDAGGYRRLSLWWDTLPGPVQPRPALAGDADADVVVVGAGLTGLWTARELLDAEPALRVVVLEREVAGFGASGRNGGWCSALFPVGPAALARRTSPDAARRLLRALQSAVADVGAALAADGVDAHWSHGGTVTLARTPAQLDRLRREVAGWRALGFGADDLAMLGAHEARAHAGATDVLGGTYTPHCAAVHPARMVRGLADAVERRGAVLYERTPVTAVEPGVARTPAGDVRAPFVVRATEAYTPQLPGHRRALVPVYSTMLATEPLPAHVWRSVGLSRRQTFTDARTLLVYGQRTADDRIAFGGRGAPYHFGSDVDPAHERDPKVLAGLWAALRELFPAVADAAVTHTWGGPLGVPRDWMPSVGLDARTGLAWAGGYVGDGVACAALAGRTLADLLLGRSTDRTDLPWVGHRSRRWEPEPLRWLAVGAALRAAAGADAAEARTGGDPARSRALRRLAGH